MPRQYTQSQALSLSQLAELEVGDYVTHIDHGIGRFGGLQKIDVDGRLQEAVKLIYAGGDILYVSIHSFHKIAKYSGKEASQPRVDRLGSGAWKALKDRAKKRVKQVAFDLIKLYAARRAVKGYAFSPDTYLQNELEASFIYEDTPDQLKATQAVKADMESDRPMDRLVCGDVGFWQDRSSDPCGVQGGLRFQTGGGAGAYDYPGFPALPQFCFPAQTDAGAGGLPEPFPQSEGKGGHSSRTWPRGRSTSSSVRTRSWEKASSSRTWGC